MTVPFHSARNPYWLAIARARYGKPHRCYRVRGENSSDGDDMASMTRRSRDVPGTHAHSKHKSERGRSIAFRAGRRSAEGADHRYWNSPPPRRRMVAKEASIAGGFFLSALGLCHQAAKSPTRFHEDPFFQMGALFTRGQGAPHPGLSMFTDAEITTILNAWLPVLLNPVCSHPQC
jgi:hypothetical protein